MAIGAAVNAFSGITRAVQGKRAAEDAAEEARLARVEMDRHKKAFEALDTSNPYLNMENTMEDLTINQQQAEFEKQQAMQSQANIMGQMRGAAGSSGIAALAQSLANQGSLQAQRASASIGAQEAQNQKLERAEAGRIQGLERQCDLMSRNMQFGKTETLMGMSADQVFNAQEMEAAGRQQMMAGIGTAASGLTSFAGAMDGNWGGNKTTDIGKTAELPGGGTGGVNDLLSNLGGQGVRKINPSANTTTGNPYPVNSQQWNQWNQLNGVNDPSMGGGMGNYP
jgi:hypothetical protein